MDTGEFVKRKVTITPTANGSYMVECGLEHDGFLYSPGGDQMVCFSNFRDLLNFLCEEYPAANQSENATPIGQVPKRQDRSQSWMTP